MSLVSIALAAYRGERFLEEQVKSILAQTHTDLELVIVDDASPDGTYALIQSLAAKDSRIKPHRNEKTSGLVSNFMKAVSLCQGEYTAFSDQDDGWAPEKIERLLRLLKADPKNMLAYSDLEIADESLMVSQGSFWKRSRIAPFSGSLGERALLKNISPGCSMLFRKEVAGLLSDCYRDPAFASRNCAAVLDETPFMHDHLAQVLAAGRGDIVYTPQKLVRYRQHSSNTIGAFYRARDSRHDFARLLKARLEALESFRPKLPGIDWGKMDRFARFYAMDGRAPMPDCISYFMFLRNGTLSGRLLGSADCLFPSVYQKVRSHAKRS